MTDKERLTAVLGDIVSISDPECLKLIAQAARSRKDDLLSAKTACFVQGTKVQMLPEFFNRKPYGAVGTIVKVNQKKFKIDFGMMGVWNVSKSMVQKAE